MFTIFWNADGVIHMAFLEPGTTIISECYIACNTQYFETKIKWSLEEQDGDFVAR